jgi:hypothetical protein
MATTKAWRFASGGFAVLCTGALASCAGGLDHPENAFVAPGKYLLYDCPQLATAEAGFVKRDQEFSRLIARAKEGPAGGLVSATVYEADYYSNLGELNDVRREQAEKNCKANPRGGAPTATR